MKGAIQIQCISHSLSSFSPYLIYFCLELCSWVIPTLPTAWHSHQISYVWLCCEILKRQNRSTTLFMFPQEIPSPAHQFLALFQDTRIHFRNFRSFDYWVVASATQKASAPDEVFNHAPGTI